MDKNLVGKWYKEDMGETINIFNEEPLRMKMSFTSSGYYNFSPNCVYEKDGLFCYEINDEHYRMVYRVKFEDGKIVGSYTQFGNETPVEYVRVSVEPEDGEFRYESPFSTLPETGEKRIDILRRFAEYDYGRKEDPYSTEYVLGGEKPSILDKYDYDSYVAGKSGDELVFALLNFVCDHFKHNGGGGTGGAGITEIIRFCERNNMSTNCRGLAILLSSLLRLNGIRARHITCMPYEQPFNDCHVVVDCELPSGARVMIDPTYRLYLKDAKGEYVSLTRLREMLISGEEYFPNVDAGYNGGGFDLSGHREYMTKNTLRFSRGTLAADGHDDDDRRCVRLVPNGYPPEDGGFSDAEKASFVFDDRKFWEM